MPAGRTSFDPTINYYEVLNVPFTATKTEIARSYRSLIRYAHPDRFPNEMDRRKAEERAKLLNAAYTVLTRSDIRKEYDQVIKQRAVNDVLFQRYTGNTPGTPPPNFYRPPQPKISPDLRRAQRRAHRAAFMQFIVFVALFVAALLIVLVVGSLIAELLDGLFA